MKYVKMLGLAVVAVAALMAFAGAGTAAADEICTEGPNAENMCPVGKKIETISASQIGSRRLTATDGSTLVTCTGADIKLSSFVGNETTSSEVTGSVEELAFTGCSTTVDVINPGTATATHGVNGGTTLKSIGGEVTVSILGVSCIYGTGAGLDLGEVSTEGTLGGSSIVNKVGGSIFCPSTAVWDYHFQVTNHTRVHYITN